MVAKDPLSWRRQGVAECGGGGSEEDERKFISARINNAIHKPGTHQREATQ